MATQYLTVEDATRYLNHVKAGWASSDTADAVERAIKVAEEMFDQRASTPWSPRRLTHTVEASGDWRELLIPRCQSVVSVSRIDETGDVSWEYIEREAIRKGERAVFGVLRTDGAMIPAGHYDITGSYGWAEPPERMLYGLRRQTARIYQDRTSFGPASAERMAEGRGEIGVRLEWDMTALQICDELGETDTVY